ncbi:MAG: histidine kinase [Eggerthellaceae bacterium]|nr:histidine kinase [Eggerthellaceae bacterium]
MFDVRWLNIAIELWGAALCLVFIACTFLLGEASKRYRRPVIGMLAMSFATSACDAVAGICRGVPGGVAWAGTHVGNFAAFAAGFLLMGFVTSYLGARIADAGGPDLRRWRTAVWASAALMCLLAALGAFYYIDDANVYHRSGWHWVGQAFLIAVNACNAALLWFNRKRLGRSAAVCLLFYTLLPLAASLLQAFVYGLSFQGIALVLGVVVLFFELQQHASRVLVESAEELAAARAEASEGRIAVMVAQMQPHFLFNTLDTIYGLTQEDPGAAGRAIASFSRYLRANLASLGKAEPVPVGQEMEHVRTYLELERASDPGRVAYEFDVQATGFRVPALSVQTLAENAVRHGLEGKAEGGTVTVRTRELPGEFTVEVADDGIGFDVAAADGDGAHVGIANTRSRLAAMCGGTLEVASEPGAGTVAVMHIPRQVEAR